MTPPTNEREKFLLACGAVLQAVVIVLCILAMLSDFRFHPIVVLCYAVTVLFSSLSRMGHK